MIAKTVVIANSRQIYQAYSPQAFMDKVYLLMETLKKHITNKACSVSHQNQLKLQDSLVAMVVICHRISLILQNSTKTGETVQTVLPRLLSIDQCQDWVTKQNENLVKPHLVSNHLLVLVPLRKLKNVLPSRLVLQKIQISNVSKTIYLLLVNPLVLTRSDIWEANRVVEITRKIS